MPQTLARWAAADDAAEMDNDEIMRRLTMAADAIRPAYEAAPVGDWMLDEMLEGVLTLIELAQEHMR